MQLKVLDEYLKDLVEDIIAYIRHLRNELDICISLNQFEKVFAPFTADIRPYCFHDCSYCRYVRQLNVEISEHCSSRKNKLYEKIGTKPFFGTCWLGVGEYIFPITDSEERIIGFISVSGYRGDPEKADKQTEKIAHRYQISTEAIRKMQSSLRRDRPPMESIQTLLMPLSYMFTLLYSCLENYFLPFRDSNLGKSHLFDSILLFVYAHIETHYKRSEIARHFSISESTLSRMFRSYTGSTYNNYANAMRFDAAKVYLSNTDISISEISDSLGYASSTYFSTAFKKHTGHTPEEYRTKEKSLLHPDNVSQSL